MIIKTKYQTYKDIVWFISRNGKAVTSFIDQVVITQHGNSKPDIKYKLRNNYTDKELIDEEDLFATKEELIKSL